MERVKEVKQQAGRGLALKESEEVGPGYRAIALFSKLWGDGDHRVSLLVREGAGRPHQELLLGRSWRKKLSMLRGCSIRYTPAVVARTGKGTATTLQAKAHWLVLPLGEEVAAVEAGYRDAFEAMRDVTRFAEWCGAPPPTDVVLTRGHLQVIWMLHKFSDQETWTAGARALDQLARRFGLRADHEMTTKLAAYFDVPGPDTGDPLVANAAYVRSRVTDIAADDFYRSLDHDDLPSPAEIDRQRPWSSSGSWVRLQCSFRPAMYGLRDEPPGRQVRARANDAEGNLVERWYTVLLPGAGAEAARFLIDNHVPSEIVAFATGTAKEGTK